MLYVSLKKYIKARQDKKFSVQYSCSTNPQQQGADSQNGVGEALASDIRSRSSFSGYVRSRYGVPFFSVEYYAFIILSNPELREMFLLFFIKYCIADNKHIWIVSYFDATAVKIGYITDADTC